MAGLVKQEVEYDSDEELFPQKVAAPEDEVVAEPEEDTTLGEWICRVSSPAGSDNRYVKRLKHSQVTCVVRRCDVWLICTGIVTNPAHPSLLFPSLHSSPFQFNSSHPRSPFHNNLPANSDVVSKYQECAVICNTVIKAVADMCIPGALVFNICKAGDDLIGELTKGIYRNKVKGRTIEKGVAFPVCVSVNDCICHVSPLASEEPVRNASPSLSLFLALCKCDYLT